jgi:hypothetical protein
MPERAPLGHQGLDDGYDLVGIAGSPDPHGQGFAGVFVDDVEELEPAPVGGLVELEVQRPHVVGPLGAQQRPTAWRSGPFAAARRRTAKSLVTPQPPGAFAVDGAPLPPQDRMRRLPSPAGMGPGVLAEPTPQLVFLHRPGPTDQTLRRPVLTDHPAGPPLRHPEAINERDRRPSSALRG